MKYRNIILSTLIIIHPCLANQMFAQEKEIEEMWRNQLNAGQIRYNKPVYLQISEEEILDLFDRQPSFGIYKDNYIISGIPTNKTINKHTSDIKFQISVRQKITKTNLPFNTFLMLTYTQKSFWNVFDKSSPFKDSNYNPGLIIGKPLINKNGLIGAVSIALEHESNGKDSLDSRGWNYAVLSGMYFFNSCFSVQGKLWAGFLDQGEPELEGGGNPDLYKYRGYGLIAFNYRSLNDKLWVSAIINP